MTQDEYIISITHENTSALTNRISKLSDLILTANTKDLKDIQWEIRVLEKEVRRRIIQEIIKI